MSLVADLKCSLAFCTRLPLGDVPMAGGATSRGARVRGALAQASWAFPLAGVVVGAAGALVYAAAAALGLAGLPAAALALAATLALTGCLHEDGLADTADGFGGGRDRARKLAIMHDSRLGTYGACALALSLMLRWSALAALRTPAAVALALVAAHAAGRAALPAFMRAVPAARSDGLSADAGRPSRNGAAAAAAIGVVALGLALGPVAGAVALLLVAATGAFLGRLALRQIGGQTGDVLGALEQASEIAILLTAAALPRALP
jgi:adenosylcobinamide-GDP ribazoletransferase